MARSVLPALFTLALPLLIAGCGGRETVGATFQSLGGAGGNSTGGEGGTGAQAPSGGSTTTSSTSSTSSTSTSSTTSTTSTTGTGGGCANGDMEKEPNDSESDAQNLGGIEDDDSTGQSISGVIAGAGDVDWFKYFGDDTFGYVVDPTRELLSNGFQLRICKFVQCEKAGTTPDFGSCPNGTDPETSPGGRPGCCGTAGFSLDLGCSGGANTDDSATVYIRIDSPSGEACAAYTINYHY